MPRVTPEHEQKRREQILRAAMACLARQGYRATSMEDIVRESGLSVGAIYSYFPSKEDLFFALAEERARQSVEYISQLFTRPGPMADKMDEAVNHLFDRLEDSYACLSLEFWSEALHSPRLQEQHAALCARIRVFFHWLLEEAKRRGEVRQDLDVPTMTELLLALHDGLLLRHVAGLLSVSRDELKRAYINLLNAALADPAHPFLKPLATGDGPQATESGAPVDGAEAPSKSSPPHGLSRGG